jgi:hypothetical protein
MALEQKKWWQKMFKQPVHKKKIDSLANIEAIKECLAEVSEDTAFLKKEFNKLEELEKERGVAHKNILEVNLTTQAKVLEKLIERYEFLANDIDINGLRLKMIATEFLEHAGKAGMKDLVKEKKADSKWRFEW